MTLKRHGGWKSNTVAEGYVEDSLNKKIDCANKILGLHSVGHSSGPSNSVSNLPIISANSDVSTALENDVSNTAKMNIDVNNDLKASQIHINNSNNCSFTINIYK